MAVHQALQQQLLARTSQEIDSLLINFRAWFRTLANLTTIEEFTDGVLDIVPELFDDATPNNITTRRHIVSPP